MQLFTRYIHLVPALMIYALPHTAVYGRVVRSTVSLV